MRLDVYLAEKGFFDTRTKAKQAVERGEVYIDGKQANKASAEMIWEKNYLIERICEEDFVSLGGFKLSKAIKDFGINVEGLCAADVGASTGGFTDCLLKNGAKRVYAVDLNDGLLHNRLKLDDKVVSVIKNAKDLERGDFGERIDFLTADLSFISATLVLPVFYNLLDSGARVVLLIKPQFENERRIRCKNGVIKDKKIIKAACKKVYEAATGCGFLPIDVTCAPLHKDKNVELLILLKKEKGEIPFFDDFIIKAFDKKYDN